MKTESLTMEQLDNEIALQKKRNELNNLKECEPVYGLLMGIVRIISNPALLIISVIMFFVGYFLGAI